MTSPSLHSTEGQCKVDEITTKKINYLKKFLQLKAYSRTLSAGVQSLIDGTLTKKLFGNFALDGLSDITQLIKSIENSVQSNIKATIEMQQALQEATDPSVLRDKVTNYLKAQSKRVDNKFEQVLAIQRETTNIVKSIENCKSKTALTIDESPTSSTPEGYLGNMNALRGIAEEDGINPNALIGKINPEQVGTTAMSSQLLSSNDIDLTSTNLSHANPDGSGSYGAIDEGELDV